MSHMTYPQRVTTILALCFARTAFAADAAEFSGFLTDYSQLEPVSSAEYADYLYVVPDAYDRLADFVGVVVPQPMIFLAPDSAFKGIKPDDMKVLADVFRDALVHELADTLPVTVTGGRRVLELQIALSNVYLRKPPRGVLGYLPVGFVVTSARQAMLSDLTKKVDLTGLTIEAQLIDSFTGERFGAYITRVGGSERTKAFESWAELETMLRLIGLRLACRFENSRLPEEQRRDCLAITSVDLEN